MVTEWSVVGAVIFALVTGHMAWVRAVLTGALVARSTLEAERTYREVRLAEKDAVIEDWQATAKTSQAQVAELLEGQATVVQLLRALQRQAITPPGGDT